ncbi:MAG: LysM peptidoglycan-binding domain-containing protein [Opitutaceae bacterium]|jgi:LysM repeat protein|nr:LysM peptidoglycan-binding domain-containing protein [Opitutaceae bacterium]
MKILKIFGIVVAVHAAAFMFVFAIPGCRSTTRRAPSPAETAAADGGKQVYYPGLTGYSTTTPPDAGAYSPVSNADLNPGITPLPVDFGTSPVQAADAPAVRFNPTRPNTPTASALQTAPVEDVQRVTTYTIAPRDSLWTIARKHGITVAELSAANNLKSDSVLPVGKKLVIPAKATPAETSGVSGDTLTYTVKAGDSLSLIARRSGTTVGAIKTLNKLKGDSVTVGQKLTLPASADTAAALAAAATAAPAAPRGASAQGTEHVVQPNETLSQIARRYGVTQRAIGAANNISDPGRLTVGQRLIIPGASRAATPVAPTPAPAPAAPVYQPEPAPVSPVSPVSTPEPSPVSAPADQPPVVPVEGASPITPAQP